MSTVRIVAAAAAVAMAVTIAWGFATGDFAADGAALLDLVWGRVTMIDLYLAFGAVWAWIAWRERSVGAALLWAVLVAVLGSLAILGYIAWRAWGATDAPDLLLGARAKVAS